MITINNVNGKSVPKKFYKFFFDYILNNNLGQIDNNIADVANFNKAKKIGFGFNNGFTTKFYLHKIFRNQPFYPKTMVVKKTWVSQNKKLVSDFMNNNMMVVKPDKGFQGKKIRLVNNVDEIINKTDDKQFWVLQDIIEPKLFNNRKFDLRVFHIIFKYKNTYYNILSKTGFAKVSAHDYKSKSEQGFLTNISHNNKIKNGRQIMYEFNNFMNLLEPNKKIKLINDIYDLIRNYSKLIAKKLESDSKNSNKPTCQIMIYGPDIIFDKNDKVFLIETNSYPGFMIDGEEVTPFQKTFMNDIMKKVFLPILQNKDIKPEEIKGDLFSIEKL